MIWVYISQEQKKSYLNDELFIQKLLSKNDVYRTILRDSIAANMLRSMLHPFPKALHFNISLNVQERKRGDSEISRHISGPISGKTRRRCVTSRRSFSHERIETPLSDGGLASDFPFILVASHFGTRRIFRNSLPKKRIIPEARKETPRRAET